MAVQQRVILLELRRKEKIWSWMKQSWSGPARAFGLVGPGLKTVLALNYRTTLAKPSYYIDKGIWTLSKLN